ncbi:MAG: DMT family transporter [Thermoplasmata archaeon]
MATSSDSTKAYLAIVTAVVSVSFASIFIKWSESPPFIIAAYRLSITCLILAPYMLATDGFSRLRNLSKGEFQLILLSGVALAFHFGLWIVSLTLTLVATSVVLVTSHPMFVAAVQHFLLKERVRRVAVAGIAIAFTGVAVIAVSDWGVGPGTLLGDMLAFLGGICAGIYFLSGRLARQKLEVVPYSFSVYGLAAMLLFVGAFASGDELIVVAPRELLLFVAMAVVPTIFGHTMFNYALKKVPAHVVSTSVLGEPVGASILAFLLLPGETPGIQIIVGGFLVVTGLFIVLSKGQVTDVPS